MYIYCIIFNIFIFGIFLLYEQFQTLAFVVAIFGFVHTQQYPAGALGSFSPSSPISTTPRPLPPAQVHYVNIGEDLTGDYKVYFNFIIYNFMYW